MITTYKCDRCTTTFNADKILDEHCPKCKMPARYQIDKVWWEGDIQTGQWMRTKLNENKSSK